MRQHVFFLPICMALHILKILAYKQKRNQDTRNATDDKILFLSHIGKKAFRADLKLS